MTAKLFIFFGAFMARSEFWKLFVWQFIQLRVVTSTWNTKRQEHRLQTGKHWYYTGVCVCAHGFINSFLSARRWYFSTASHNLAHTLPAARCHTPTVSTSIVPGPSFSDQWPSESWFVLRQLHHWCCTQSFGFVRYASFFRPKTQRPSFRFSKEPLSTRWPLITPGQSLTLYGGFLKSGYPHSWMVYKYNGKIHSNGWFGGPLFQETSICLERIWKEYTHLSSWHGSSSSTKFRLGTCILHPAAFLSVRALKQHCSENEANSNA